MDNKNFDASNDKTEQELETTKEVITLHDLSLEALNNLEEKDEEVTEEADVEDLDENMEKADLVFKTEVETKEEVKEELAKEKKENIFKKNAKK